MRAAGWSNFRDRAAARASWQRARQVADGLPADDADRVRMQIQPRTLLCATAFLANVSFDDSGFQELQELCAQAGDKVSLAIAMSGAILALAVNGRPGDAAGLSPEFIELVDAIGDPALTVGLYQAAVYAYSEAGEPRESLRLAQRVIDLADGDPTMGNLILGSPLSTSIGMKSVAKMRLGAEGWKADADAALAMAAPLDSTSQVSAVLWKYVCTIPFGALAADVAALTETASALRIAEQTGDDFLLGLAQLTHGQMLVRRGGSERDEGLSLLRQARGSAERGRFVRVAMPLVDPQLAREKARTGDFDGAIDMARSVLEDDFETGEMLWLWLAATVLVESLLARRANGDLQEAQATIDRFKAATGDPGCVHDELTVLRLSGLLAEARGDAGGYQQYNERFRAKAAAAGFEPLAAGAWARDA
jgi:hypothetical protein